MCWDPGQKQWFDISFSQAYLLVSESLLERRGAAVTHAGNIDTCEYWGKFSCVNTPGSWHIGFLGCLKTKEPIATSRHGLAHQRAKAQLHPPVNRHRPLLPGGLHKPLDQPHPPGGRHQKQENCDPTKQARPYPEPIWALALLTSRPVQPSGHPRPHTQLCQEPAPVHQWFETSSGIPEPCSQIPGTSSACQ